MRTRRAAQPAAGQAARPGSAGPLDGTAGGKSGGKCAALGLRRAGAGVGAERGARSIGFSSRRCSHPARTTAAITIPLASGAGRAQAAGAAAAGRAGTARHRYPHCGCSPSPSGPTGYTRDCPTNLHPPSLRQRVPCNMRTLSDSRPGDSDMTPRPAERQSCFGLHPAAAAQHDCVPCVLAARAAPRAPCWRTPATV